ncbi:hypothetical protein ACLB1G_03435 [Oxalobacteraceae bacterium A2-2]
MELSEETRRQFIQELWRRFEDLQQWAVDNWPDRDHPLSSADFVEARKEILGLRAPHQSAATPRDAAEPEDGGPQYVDVTPAPWP